METHSDYKQKIESYIEDLNKICSEGVHYEADYNPCYGGWRLNKYKEGSSATQMSVLSNYERIPSKYFVYYLHGIVATMHNINLLTKPF